MQRVDFNFLILRRFHRAYIRLFLPQARMVSRFIEKAAPTASIGTCVEIGCGACDFKALIKKTWMPTVYVGTDFDSDSQANVVADAALLPLRSASVDLAVAFQVLQHVPDFRLVLGEAARIVSPGGWLIVSYPFMYGECDVFDFRRWTQRGMEQDLRNSGFEAVKHKKLGGLLFMIVMLIGALVATAIPGGRLRWHFGASRWGMLRAAAVTILSMPFHLIGWVVLPIDRLWSSTPYYVGGIVLARRTA